jgi:phosphoglycolate phosphatase-like HAD superfamily hydrolase
MKLLFWDIDGTLLRTAKAGLYALEEAAEELFGIKTNFEKIQAAGMTDYSIAAQIIRNATRQEPLQHDILALTRRYEELLPGHLAKRTGFVLPSVIEILSSLQEQKDFASFLLTGNSRIGAQAKLRHYQIDHFFDFDASAFCVGCLQRNEISVQALRTVTTSYAHVSLDDVYVIGDTPNDISCGKHIGARTISVATGSYTTEQLALHDPWWVVETLPSAANFIEKLQTAQ